jgi:hypothetical protein
VNFDVNSLLASLGVSSVGFVAFVYGKKQSRAPHLIVGLVMMLYPYVVTNVLLMTGIAVVMLLGLWLAVRLGM